METQGKNPLGNHFQVEIRYLKSGLGGCRGNCIPDGDQQEAHGGGERGACLRTGACGVVRYGVGVG